ncbi:MAG: four helix bundle protein [Candidatus Liptonbacteria bacterium]|nr:four helix bundle protein [Candidatus Liptonbacteria bacterium]
MTTDYLDKLKKRASESKVYKKYQLIGLEISQTLEDEKHKSLYIKLAKEGNPERLLRLAKEVAEKKNVKNKGAYFMSIAKGLDISNQESNKMSKIQSFEDLKVWRDAHAFTILTYKITEKFPKHELFGLISQLRRSSSSIGANIAEGCGRFHYKEKIKFYLNARGSAIESQSHILLARDLGYISSAESEKLFNCVAEILRELNGLIKATGKKP